MAATVVNCDVEEDLYDEEQDEGTEDGCGIECLHCNDELTHNTDVACIELVIPYMNAAPPIQYMLVVDDEGEPKLPAAFLEYDCFETVGEELSSQLEDVPPVIEHDPALTCDYCNSSIRMGEICISIHLGEIVESGRLNSSTFVPVEGPPYIACMRCARKIYDICEIDGYEDTLTQHGECGGCTDATCWRVGRCMCACHHVRRR